VEWLAASVKVIRGRDSGLYKRRCGTRKARFSGRIVGKPEVIQIGCLQPGKLLINAAVSMGRRNTQLKPAFALKTKAKNAG